MNKTMKTAKIVIGIFFLVFSGLYLIGVLSYAAYAKSEATYYSSSDCLRMEFEESRYIGERAVTEWGEREHGGTRLRNLQDGFPGGKPGLFRFLRNSCRENPSGRGKLG